VSETRGPKVLRIQRSANDEVVITLSGRLDKESIPELETLIRGESGGQPIVLDLKNLTLAGRDAIEFLARCEAAGVGLANCAPYVREWITREGTGN
jgi:anti-anti-sigma regulatory factor